MSSKADLVLQAADVIRETINEQVARLRMPTQPMPQFFGPPLTSHQMLMLLAFDRSKLNHVMERVPEPDPGTSPARVIHGRKSRMRSGDPEVTAG